MKPVNRIADLDVDGLQLEEVGGGELQQVDGGFDPFGVAIVVGLAIVAVGIAATIIAANRNKPANLHRV
jgi:hypothetical protein